MQFHYVLKRQIPHSVSTELFSLNAGGSPLAVLVGQREVETSRTVESH
jgi:hypothetical protein